MIALKALLEERNNGSPTITCKCLLNAHEGKVNDLPINDGINIENYWSMHTMWLLQPTNFVIYCHFYNCSSGICFELNFNALSSKLLTQYCKW